MYRGILFLNSSSGSFDPLVGSTLRTRAAELELQIIELDDNVDLGAVIAERRRQGVHLFIAAGGDGTIGAVAQHLIGSDAILGIVPTGTVNHFARDLSLPLDPVAALDVAVNGESRQIDAGRINEQYFLNNLVLGIYPEVFAQREQLRDRYGKWRAFAHALHLALRSFPSVSITLETAHHQEALKTQLFMVSVNPYDLAQLGMVALRESLDRGHLTVYWMPKLDRPAFVRILTRYFRGKVDALDGLRQINTTTVKVHTSQKHLRVGIDGELHEMKPPLTITIVPTALNVRVSPAQPGTDAIDSVRHGM